MASIKELYYHIKGTPKVNETTNCNNNYVAAWVSYDKGKGYFMNIRRYGRFTWHDDTYGDCVMQSFSLWDDAPHLSECLVPCSRAGKARERDAIALFDARVQNAVAGLGYEVDQGGD